MHYYSIGPQTTAVYLASPWFSSHTHDDITTALHALTGLQATAIVSFLTPQTAEIHSSPYSSRGSTDWRTKELCRTWIDGDHLFPASKHRCKHQTVNTSLCAVNSSTFACFNLFPTRFCSEFSKLLRTRTTPQSTEAICHTSVSFQCLYPQLISN